MLKSIAKLIGGSSERDVEKIRREYVDKVNGLEQDFDALTDEGLRDKTRIFKALTKGRGRFRSQAESFVATRAFMDRVTERVSSWEPETAGDILGSVLDVLPEALTAKPNGRACDKLDGILDDFLPEGLSVVREEEEDRGLRALIDEMFEARIEDHAESWGGILDGSFTDLISEAVHLVVREDLEDARDRLGDILGLGDEEELEEILDDILPEAFAAVRQAAKRTLGQRHFDEQIIGGVVLHQGKIAEMRTGEGKTLVATLPAYLNGLTGGGVHVVTVNDYLARRDAQWMGQVYDFLGLSVGVLQHDSAYLYDSSGQGQEGDGAAA